MSKEAMKLALEALEYIEHNYMSLPAPAEKAITALREALAEQPAQQEPVAWTNWRELVGARHYRTPGWEMYADKRNPDDVAIYTAPPAQRKPLSNEQIGQAAGDAYIAFCLNRRQTYEHALTRAIEAAHGIKENT